MPDQKDVAKIVIHYDDNSTREVNKGFIAHYIDNGEEIEITYSMVHMAGKEIYSIIEGMVELALKLGIFKDNKIKDDTYLLFDEEDDE